MTTNKYTWDNRNCPGTNYKTILPIIDNKIWEFDDYYCVFVADETPFAIFRNYIDAKDFYKQACFEGEIIKFSEWRNRK